MFPRPRIRGTRAKITGCIQGYLLQITLCSTDFFLLLSLNKTLIYMILLIPENRVKAAFHFLISHMIKRYIDV